MVYASNAMMSPVKPSTHTNNNYYATMKEKQKQIKTRKNKHIQTNENVSTAIEQNNGRASKWLCHY